MNPAVRAAIARTCRRSSADVDAAWAAAFLAVGEIPLAVFVASLARR